MQSFFLFNRFVVSNCSLVVSSLVSTNSRIILNSRASTNLISSTLLSNYHNHPNQQQQCRLLSNKLFVNKKSNQLITETTTAVGLRKQSQQQCLLLSTSTKSEPEVIVEIRDTVQWIRLNRPNKYNSLSIYSYTKLVETLNNSANDPNVKMTVITGNGKYFSSGNDLS